MGAFLPFLPFSFLLWKVNKYYDCTRGVDVPFPFLFPFYSFVQLFPLFPPSPKRSFNKKFVSVHQFFPPPPFPKFSQNFFQPFPLSKNASQLVRTVSPFFPPPLLLQTTGPGHIARTDFFPFVHGPVVFFFLFRRHSPYCSRLTAFSSVLFFLLLLTETDS